MYQISLNTQGNKKGEKSDNLICLTLNIFIEYIICFDRSEYFLIKFIVNCHFLTFLIIICLFFF